MNEFIEAINRRLEEILSSYNQDDNLCEAMKYSCLANGKRFRPLIILYMLSDRKIDYNYGLDVACAIEMLHTYSLIHDDLPVMDDDDYRRGILTNHKKFGENIAILAGDALLTESFNVISSSNLSNEIKINIIKDLSRLAGANGMVAGQSLDVTSSGKLSKILLEKIHMHKTHDLILASFLAGAYILKMTEEEIIKIKECVKYLGLAFQVKDDIRDLTENFDKLGKDVNSDIKNNKITYPKIYGLDKSREILENLLQNGLSIIEDLFGKNRLYSLIEGLL